MYFCAPFDTAIRDIPLQISFWHATFRRAKQTIANCCTKIQVYKCRVHSFLYCGHPPRYVKYGGDHGTKECKKSKKIEPKFYTTATTCQLWTTEAIPPTQNLPKTKQTLQEIRYSKTNFRLLIQPIIHQTATQYISRTYKCPYKYQHNKTHECLHNHQRIKISTRFQPQTFSWSYWNSSTW